MNDATDCLEAIETDEELVEVLDRAARVAGLSVEDLRIQAKEGTFASEKARTAWFIISNLSGPGIA